MIAVLNEKAQKRKQLSRTRSVQSIKIRILPNSHSHKNLLSLKSTFSMPQYVASALTDEINPFRKNASLKTFDRNPQNVTSQLETKTENALDRYKQGGASTIVKRRIDLWKKQKPSLKIQNQPVIRQIKSQNLLMEQKTQFSSPSHKLNLKVRNPFQKRSKKGQAGDDFAETSFTLKNQQIFTESGIFCKEVSAMSESHQHDVEQFLAIMS